MIEKLLSLVLLPQDKANHALHGCAIFAVAQLQSLLFAGIAVGVIAVGKEIYDAFHRDLHTPDVRDALATMAGGLIGYVCTL
ncbi:MAG: hypothetical protein AB1400_05645 [Pseudomonadota bacterium]